MDKQFSKTIFLSNRLRIGGSTKNFISEQAVYSERSQDRQVPTKASLESAADAIPISGRIPRKDAGNLCDWPEVAGVYFHTRAPYGTAGGVP